jgi:peptidoglycan hydrolase CwlO-like protein
MPKLANPKPTTVSRTCGGVKIYFLTKFLISFIIGAIMKGKEFSKDREFAVILEKIHSEIKVISEGQSLLRDKLDSTMGMVAKNREDITMLVLRVSGIKEDINRIDGKLAKIEEDIMTIKTDFGKRLTHLEALK